MAEETPADGYDSADPTVSLTADVAPWEAALEKARAATDAWTARVTERLDTWAAAVAARTDRAAKAIADVRAKAEETGDLAGAVGSALGGLAGGALGTLIGGPAGAVIGQRLGTAIGEQIGPAIAQAVDFEKVIGEAGGLADGVKAQAADVADTWGSAVQDVQDAWTALADLVGGFSVSDLLSGDLDAAALKVASLVTDVGSKVEGLTEQIAARIADLIDRTVERAKEPFAAVADFLQGVLQQLGVVEAGTASWGDALREVEGVGQRVFETLAAGLGYVRDAVDIVVGAVESTLGAAFTQAAADVSRTIAGLLEQVRDTANALGVNVFGATLDAAINSAKAAASQLDQQVERVVRDGEARIERGLAFGRAEEYRRQVADFLARGRARNDLADLDRALDEWLQSGEERIEAVAAATALDARRVSAAVEGSREAVRLAIADSTRADPGGPADAQNRAAKAAEETARASGMLLTETQGLRRDLRDLNPIGVI